MEELILKKKPKKRISKVYCIWFQFSKLDNQKLNKIKKTVNSHLKGPNFLIHLTTIGPYLKLDKKELVMYIYAGKPNFGYQSKFGTEARLQLNDKFSEVSDIPAFIYAERESKREELRPFLTTALKVDKETNMGIIGDINQELRKVNALKINYTTRIGDVSLNKK